MDEDLRARFRAPNPNHRPAQPSHRQPEPLAPKPTLIEPRFKLSQPKKPVEHTLQNHKKLTFEPPANLKPKKSHKKLYISLAVLLIITGMAWGGKLWAYPKLTKHNVNPFPVAIQNAVKFPLYYPSSLPAGYNVSSQSFKTTSTEVVFYATKGSDKLVFTQQKAPASFDFNGFYAQHLSNSQRFSSPYGSIVVGKNDTRNLGSLVTGKTWLLLSTNSTNPSINDMGAVLQNLKQY